MKVVESYQVHKVESKGFLLVTFYFQLLTRKTEFFHG